MASLLPENSVFDWDSLADDLRQEQKRKINRQAQRRFQGAKMKGDAARASNPSSRQRQNSETQSLSIIPLPSVHENLHDCTPLSPSYASLPDTAPRSRAGGFFGTMEPHDDQPLSSTTITTVSSCPQQLHYYPSQQSSILPLGQSPLALCEEQQLTESALFLGMDDPSVDSYWQHAHYRLETSTAILSDATYEDNLPEVLTKSGPSVESATAPRYDGDTPVSEHGFRQQSIAVLHTAASTGQAGIIDMLLAAGAYIDPVDASGATPLHLAAKNGHENAVRALLRGGTNTNARDHQNYTPLHLAVAGGHDAVVGILINHGADISIAAIDPNKVREYL